MNNHCYKQHQIKNKLFNLLLFTTENNKKNTKFSNKVI